MPSAIDRFPDIVRRLRARRLAAFFDYDGTLVPIVARPEDAVLPKPMRLALARLSTLTAVTAIVSGRALQDLKRRVGLPGLVYAGCHGFEIEGAGDGRIERHEGHGFDQVVRRAAAALTAATADIPGSVIEDKVYCVATHYRGVAADQIDALKQKVDAVAASFPDLRRTYGKKVIELRPDIPWDKGRAVRWILESLGLTGTDVLPVYFGDDKTDDDAFRALTGVGIGIFVSSTPEPTVADYRLRSTAEVQIVLERIIAVLHPSC